MTPEDAKKKSSEEGPGKDKHHVPGSGSSSGLDALITLGGFVLGGIALYKGAKAVGQLADATIDLLGAVAKHAAEARAEEQRQLEAAIRDKEDLMEWLRRADALLLTGQGIDANQAALLLSSVLEAGLCSLGGRKGVSLGADDPGGLATWAHALSDASVISKREFIRLMHFGRIRNRVVHGVYDGFTVDDVREFASFVREFFADNELP